MVRVVKAQVIDHINLENSVEWLKHIERIGRTAWQSYGNITDNSASGFIRMIIRRGHESVLEHHSVTLILRVNREMAQQITRHRLASYTMESQRYVNYSLDKFDQQVPFIDPEFPMDVAEQALPIWQKQMDETEKVYFELLKHQCRPEDARLVLNNSVACTLCITANLREWRYILKLRTAPDVQHNLRRLMKEILDLFYAKAPDVFYDLMPTFL